MIKTIKAKTEIKQSKNGYYFGVLFVDDEKKWFNLFESNLDIITRYYNDFVKGETI